MLRFPRRSAPGPPRSFSLHTEAAGSAPPDAFGPFRVLHQIGAGALGPVFRAYDPEQDKLVAVKLFRLDLPPERVHELVADFERMIAADLTHSAIVAVVATGIVQVSPYLAQDFVAADSLDTVIREHGPAPTAEALRIITQIAGGLDYAGVVGVVHGALHPRDVLISPDDVRLTGFGVARALERIGVQLPLRRPYAAPERAAGGAWDRRADVFTLATLAHELLWGRRITAIGAEAAAALEELSGASLTRLRETFARALAENPGQRHPTALEFADALKNCFTEREERRPVVPARPASDYRRGLVDDEAPVKREEAPPPAAAPLLPLVADVVPEAARVADREPARSVDDDLTLRSPEPAPTGHDHVEPMIAMSPSAAPSAAEKADEERERFEVVANAAIAEAPAPAEVSLAAAESHVHAEPPLRAEPPPRAEPPVRPEYPVSFGASEPLGPARSAVWPLTLALLLGVALGFAGGYWLGQSDGQREPVQASAGGTTASETEVRLKNDPATGAGPAPAAGGPAATSSRPEPPATTAPPLAAAPPKASAAAAPKPAETTAVARTGRITVRTTPDGARVTIDGRDVGKAPLTIPNLGRGTYTVRVMRDGYSPVERRVAITADQPTSTLTLNLARASGTAPRPAPPEPAAQQTADVFFESRPTGATVFIDGKRIGTTPVALPSVRAGSHAVRFELSGHRPWTASIRVVAGEKNRVAASLEQQ